MLTLSKLKEIVEAWAISVKPNEKQKKRAILRYAMCKPWEYNKNETCSLCGCPLNKKVFSTRLGACDDGRWDKIDTIHEK